MNLQSLLAHPEVYQKAVENAQNQNIPLNFPFNIKAQNLQPKMILRFFFNSVYQLTSIN